MVKQKTSWSTGAGLVVKQHVARRVRCPHAVALENLWKRHPQCNPEDQEKVLCGTETQVRPTRHVQTAGGDLQSTSEAWIGSIEESDVVLIGLLGGQGNRQDCIARRVEN